MEKWIPLTLVICGLVAITIGASILFWPAQFHALNGIEVGSDPNSLSEARAPGGALALFGLFMFCGAFVHSLARPALLLAGAVYLAYGSARLLSVVLDGVPATGLLVATAIELGLGGVALALFVRSVGPHVGEWKGCGGSFCAST